MIIGIVGLIASGKDTLASYLIDKGFEHISLSAILRQEAKKRHLDTERKTLQDLGTSLKQEQGEQILAKLALANQSKDNLVVTSLRHPAEVEYFRTHTNAFYLVALSTDIKTRFSRACLRARTGDAKTLAQFKAQEERETGSTGGQQLGKTMQMADFYLDNNGNEQALYRQVDQLLIKLEVANGPEKT